MMDDRSANNDLIVAGSTNWISMNAYKIRSIVIADGSIVLRGIPFSVGKSVEVIVLEDVSDRVADSDLTSPKLDERWKSLQGSVTHYYDPFDSAIPRHFDPIGGQSTQS
jgi:hypothetical protein